MSIDVPISLPPLTLTTLSLAQLHEAILANPGLSSRQKTEAASALRSLAKAFGRPMQAISACPADLRKAMKDMTAAMACLSEGRWRNVRSLTQFALSTVGLCKVPARYSQALAPEWATLIKPLSRPGDRHKLAHFGRYCDTAGIVPDQVNNAVMAKFLDDLQTSSLASEPERTHRDAAIAWNKCAAENPTWPQQTLTVPDNRRGYALPWTTFPATLKADVDAWLRRLSGLDFFNEAEFDPLRPASLILREKQIHEFVSALVLQGEDAAELRILADVVTRARMGIGLKFFWDRAGGKASAHGSQIAGVVRSIARHWVKLDQSELDKLKAISRKITPRATGMTDRNRSRLRPLGDPKTMRSLLTLPERVRAEVVRQGAPTRSLALLMQSALAIEILVMVPMRIKNLAGLQIDVHLLRGRDRGLTLVLPEDEVKNSMAHEASLPAATVQLVDLYLSRYWPLLGGPASSWLFPGSNPTKPKCGGGLRQQIQDILRKRCGLHFHPHLFRHLAAMVMLDLNPTAHGQVQRVLGHKTINTTLQYYSGMETKAAMQHYDEQVLRLRGDAPLPGADSHNRKARK